MMPPRPDYDYEINKLLAVYRRSFEAIRRQLERVDLDDFSRAQQMALLKSVGDILKELDTAAIAWVDESITLAASDGIARAIVSLGAAETIAEAKTIIKFNRVNKELVKAIVADTQTDLLAVTQNVDRRFKRTVRKVGAEVLRENVAQGINGTQTLRRDVVRALRDELGDSLDTGIIDAAGRRWKPNNYAEVLVRSKMMEAHVEASVNEALGRGVQYGVISSHGAKDACRNWEGKIVAFTREAPGDYPYVGDLPRKEIFHPCCKHVISPVRRPDRA